MYYQASPSPGLSNNPFVQDSTTVHERFPDINAPSFQPGYPSNGYSPQPPHFQQSYGQYQAIYPPQYQTQPQPQPAGVSAFQTPTGFAHQLPQQYPIPSGYPYSTVYPTQQTNPPPSYLSEFDPYAQQPQSPPQVNQTSTGPAGTSHPRDLIRIYKSELEAWDTYSWKQLLGACDALKEAWSVRKQQAERIVRQYGGNPDLGLFGPDPAFGYNAQVEGWKQVLKDANDHFDTVVASTFQLHEVFNSYRHSSDLASKRRVRESCNAAVKGLPDWPGN